MEKDFWGEQCKKSGWLCSVQRASRDKHCDINFSGYVKKPTFWDKIKGMFEKN